MATQKYYIHFSMSSHFDFQPQRNQMLSNMSMAISSSFLGFMQKVKPSSSALILPLPKPQNVQIKQMHKQMPFVQQNTTYIVANIQKVEFAFTQPQIIAHQNIDQPPQKQINKIILVPYRKCPVQYEGEFSKKLYQCLRVIKMENPQLKGLTVIQLVDGLYDTYHRFLSDKLYEKYPEISQPEVDSYVQVQYSNLTDGKRVTILNMFIQRRKKQCSNMTDLPEVNIQQHDITKIIKTKSPSPSQFQHQSHYQYNQPRGNQQLYGKYRQSHTLEEANKIYQEAKQKMKEQIQYRLRVEMQRKNHIVKLLKTKAKQKKKERVGQEKDKTKTQNNSQDKKKSKNSSAKNSASNKKRVEFFYSAPSDLLN